MEQGGYAGRGGGGGTFSPWHTVRIRANVGTMFRERELGQNVGTYGGERGPAAEGRGYRIGASTGDKLVDEHLYMSQLAPVAGSGAHTSAMLGTMSCPE